MSDLIARTFGTLEDEFYPGSKRRRRESREARHSRVTKEKAEAKAKEAWDSRPRKVWVQGVEYEMFPIGALAKALGRSPVTIRSWINFGWIPKARFKTRPIRGTRGDAGRRLWTRAQIEGMVRIAKEEGLGKKTTKIQQTRFSEKVFSQYRTWT